MTSAIDATKPETGDAFTADMRANFATAASEITALQDANDGVQTELSTLQQQIVDLQTRVTALEGQVANLQAGSFTGTWAWQSSPLVREVVEPPQKPIAGLDTTDPTQAAALSITPADDTGADFSAALERLQTGDGLLIWQRTNSANRLRYDITAPGAQSGNYFVLPITNTLAAGVEPGNGVEVMVQLLFSA